MWSSLNDSWKKCLELVWESYKKGSIPIGAIIVDENNNIVATGRNKIYEKGEEGEIYGSCMAHAEMNALIKIKDKDHPNVKKYTIYTSMEPCPMCFGTIIMVGIRNIVYGGRDRFAGATVLSNRHQYIESKKLSIKGPDNLIEKIQLAIQSEYELGRQHRRMNELLDSWAIDCGIGVLVGRELHREGYLKQAKENNLSAAEVMDYIMYKIEAMEELKQINA